jgi:hypothetical protein
MARERQVLRGADHLNLSETILIVVLLLSTSGTVSGADASTPSRPGTDVAAPELNELITALRSQTERLHSLAVDYTIDKKALVDPRIVKRYTGMAFLPQEEKTFAFSGSKRLYNYYEVDKGQPLAPEVEPDYVLLLGKEEVRPRTEVPPPSAKGNPGAVRQGGEAIYDGSRLYQRNTNNLIITDFSRLPNLQDDLVLFNQEYLNMTGRALPDLSLKHQGRGTWCLHEALARGELKVRPSLVEENGHLCVVVEVPGDVAYWLDPELGFAVRRWEKFDPASKMTTWAVSHRQFAEVEPGLWLPRLTWRDLYGSARIPEPYRGKPLVRQIFTVQRHFANNLPDAFFIPLVEPGCHVHDFTRVPYKEKDTKGVLFKMPAYPETFDAVIGDVLARPKSTASWVHSLWPVGLAGLSIMAAFGLLLTMRFQLSRCHKIAVAADRSLCPRPGGPT